MKYEWDEQKRESNITKHKIFFELAIEIFDDCCALTSYDMRKEYGEIREITIGKTYDGVLILVVVHTDRNGKIRIISARRANKNEREMYNEINNI